ncbi:MAG: hypothetical protein WBQ23_04965 [Bacteroidota bacterium]
MNTIYTIAICLTMIAVMGCSSSLSHEDFLPDATTLYKSKQTLQIESATGGSSERYDYITGAVGVTDAELLSTIQAFLDSTGAFQATSPGTVAHYTLIAAILDTDHSLACLNCWGEITINYRLRDEYTQRDAWSQTFTTEHTVGLGKNFIGSVRVRLAMVGAMYENVRQMIIELAAMKL